MAINFNCDDETMDKLVKEFRAKFMTEHSNHSELYDEKDVGRMNENDFLVKRFIWKMGPEDGYKDFMENMLWRKRMEVNNFDPTVQVPKEIFETGAIFSYLADKEGTKTLYIRAKMHRMIPKVVEHIKYYFVFHLNKLDRGEGLHKFALIIDGTGAGLAQADLPLLMFIIRTLRHHFPLGCKYVLIYGLPWILKAFANLVLTFVPSEDSDRVIFAGEKELLEKFDVENLPDFMKGTCEENYRKVPKNAIPAHELAKCIGMQPKEVDKMLKSYQVHIRPDLCQEITDLSLL